MKIPSLAARRFIRSRRQSEHDRGDTLEPYGAFHRWQPLAYNGRGRALVNRLAWRCLSPGCVFNSRFHRPDWPSRRDMVANKISHWPVAYRIAARGHRPNFVAMKWNAFFIGINIALAALAVAALLFVLFR